MSGSGDSRPDFAISGQCSGETDGHDAGQIALSGDVSCENATLEEAGYFLWNWRSSVRVGRHCHLDFEIIEKLLFGRDQDVVVLIGRQQVGY